MKYIILGKSLKTGVVGDDSINLNEYFELGWEVVGSRFDIIKLINTDQLDLDTTLVTTEDRKFFYTKIFPNVITYSEFIQTNTKNDEVIDWTVNPTKTFNFLNVNSFVDSDGKYIRHSQDYDLLFDGFDLSNSKIQENSSFVVIGLRYRDHINIKNSSEDFFGNLVSSIKKNITKKIYVVGRGSEFFCEKYKCQYVEKLVDFVSLIKNKNCKGYITQSTGTACLSFVCSEAPIYLIDNNRCSDINGNNAVLGGKCIQLCPYEITPYYSLDESNIVDIISRLKK
jgi:hypothetical protein